MKVPEPKFCQDKKSGEFMAWIRPKKGVKINTRGKTPQEALDKLLLKCEELGFIEPAGVTLNSQTPANTFVTEYIRTHLKTKLKDKNDLQPTSNVRKKNKTLSTNTLNKYIDMLAHFSKHFNSVKMADIDAIKLNRFYSIENAEYASETVHEVYKQVNNMYTWAVKEGYLQINPMAAKGFEELSFTQPLNIDGYSAGDLQRYATLFKDSVFDPIFRTLCETGMRIEELCGLQWCDIDFHHKTIHICRAIVQEYEFDDNMKRESTTTRVGTTKTISSERIIALTPSVEIALIKWKRFMATNGTVGDDVFYKDSQNRDMKANIIARLDGKEEPLYKGGIEDADFIFCNTKNPRWTPSGLNSSIRHFIFEKAGEKEKFCSHKIRHSVATAMVEDGQPTEMIMKQLGHATPAMVRRYINKHSEKISRDNGNVISKGMGRRMESGEA